MVPTTLPQLSAELAAAVPWLTAEQMVEVDRATVEDFGIQLIQMMEHAGRHLAHLARERFLDGSVLRQRVVVLAGPGGNGGGALAGARHLVSWGADVSVLISADPTHFSGASGHQLRILGKMGVDVSPELGLPRQLPDLIVDGLIGYGLRGVPQGRTADLIREANRGAVPVPALDVPSGLDSTTGEAVTVVRATATLTLALPKLGLRQGLSAGSVGELYLADIGVPPAVYARRPLQLRVPDLFARGDVVGLASIVGRRRRNKGLGSPYCPTGGLMRRRVVLLLVAIDGAAWAGAGPWTLSQDDRSAFVGASYGRFSAYAGSEGAVAGGGSTAIGTAVTRTELTATVTYGLLPAAEVELSAGWAWSAVGRRDVPLCDDLGLGACADVRGLVPVTGRFKVRLLDEFRRAPVSVAVGPALRLGDYTRADRQRLTSLGDGQTDLGAFAAVGRTGGLGGSWSVAAYVEPWVRYRLPVAEVSGHRAPGDELGAAAELLVNPRNEIGVGWSRTCSADRRGPTSRRWTRRPRPVHVPVRDLAQGRAEGAGEARVQRPPGRFDRRDPLREEQPAGRVDALGGHRNLPAEPVAFGPPMSTGGASARRGRRFHLVARLGAGSYGQVFLAEQESHGGFRRRVALKVLQSGLAARAGAEALRRMRDEARLLGLLSHRNIVRVLDLVQLGDSWAIVMEPIDGPDLEVLLEAIGGVRSGSRALSATRTHAGRGSSQATASQEQSTSWMGMTPRNPPRGTIST